MRKREEAGGDWTMMLNYEANGNEKRTNVSERAFWHTTRKGKQETLGYR